MKKRLLSIMLTVIMGATLLVGCGGNSSKCSRSRTREIKGRDYVLAFFYARSKIRNYTSSGGSIYER
ncbi:hypothetical protein [Clostridium tertium]|uniref:hypothetical protein n=1 Tax=Clostridium tertium TaxID=1559 RepID=UPI00241D5EA4|nr:hypothetical protein [Clostridium tertium]